MWLQGEVGVHLFTGFDFDYHENKLAHVHHISDKFSFNLEYCDSIVYKHVT